MLNLNLFTNKCTLNDFMFNFIFVFNKGNIK